MIEKSELPDRWTSASEIVRRIAAREQSAVEATMDALQRLERLNPTYRAVTFTDADAALNAAADVDRRLASGAPVGTVAGLPTLMKDLYGFRPGWPTTLGGLSAARDDVAPAGVWSRYPQQITAGDGILLGQTNSSTFGFSGVTDNATFGPSRNPFESTRNTGGSSGGSAGAVASGMVAAAGASDAGGSIRIPAAWTNTFGFQPSAGRVPSTPRPSLFHLGPHLYEGPVTRTVEDAVLIMNALQGFDPHDPYSAPSAPFSPDLRHRGVRGMRIGLSDDLGGFPVNPLIRETIARAAEKFEQLGAIVEPVRLDLTYSHDDLTRMWLRSVGLLMLADLDAFRDQGRPLSPDDLPATVHHWTEEARGMTVSEVRQDRVMRTAVLDGLLEATAQHDLLVGPTVTELPVRNAANQVTVGPSMVDGQPVNPLIGWCPTYLTNFSGSPSASIPAGLVDGLPVGMLVIGRKHRDEDVFAAAAALEAAHPWAHLYSRVH